MKVEKNYIQALRCPNFFFFQIIKLQLVRGYGTKLKKVKKLTTRMQQKANCCLTSGESQNLENSCSSKGNRICVGTLRSSNSNRAPLSFRCNWNKVHIPKQDVSGTLSSPSNTGVISSNGV